MTEVATSSTKSEDLCIRVRGSLKKVNRRRGRIGEGLAKACNVLSAAALV